MPVSFLPNVAPHNNNSQQMRRRVNDTTSTLTTQVGSIATGTGDLGTLHATKAPSNSPVLSNVTQDSPAKLTAATVSTRATSGSAAVLPTAPAGYMTQTINGKTYKIPLYQE